MASKHIEPAQIPALMSVTEKESPIAFKAWVEWRLQEFGCHFVPRAFSVPSLFPPGTQEGANAYAEQLRDIRREVRSDGKGDKNWKPVPLHPRPWS